MRLSALPDGTDAGREWRARRLICDRTLVVNDSPRQRMRSLEVVESSRNVETEASTAASLAMAMILSHRTRPRPGSFQHFRQPLRFDCALLTAKRFFGHE